MECINVNIKEIITTINYKVNGNKLIFDEPIDYYVDGNKLIVVEYIEFGCSMFGKCDDKSISCIVVLDHCKQTPQK